ncbi:MAG: aminotransferase class I/II-fold pyridoxal phosphate-dependent enzyme [Armatimonadota bacterium]|nr:aminotransferase class I/II-fold pyridoxal phosphate-dependent enzyme [Armatimonadota bacterium]MDW8156558.1 aminotransferase class I/II-fold pyridoxal phosphate-dependent enzyme [Armatimonadota bacterium]
MERKPGFNTLAAHAGRLADPYGAVAPPIYQSSTFAFPTVEEGARRATSYSEAFYTRWGNPTVRLAEQRLAALEGAEACVLTASGMAAVSVAVLSAVRAGDHVVCADCVYSGTFELFHRVLPRLGVETTFVDPKDPDNYARALRPNTRLVYVETPANPVLSVTDIRAVAELSRRVGAVCVADNTFATPYNTRPLELGVDVVVHSATKYLGGHHHLVLGAVAGPERLLPAWREQLRVFGGCADPFSAWLLLTGVQTLGLRVERQNATAHALAEFLQGHPRVERVYYPGLPDHPGHTVARGQMRGFGGVLSFEVAGGLEAGRRVVERLRWMKLAVSLGGVHTLVTHAASTTHVHVPREERMRAGISDGLIRVAVGIEDVEDLLEDLEQALA